MVLPGIIQNDVYFLKKAKFLVDVRRFLCGELVAWSRALCTASMDAVWVGVGWARDWRWSRRSSPAGWTARGTESGRPGGAHPGALVASLVARFTDAVWVGVYRARDWGSALALVASLVAGGGGRAAGHGFKAALAQL